MEDRLAPEMWPELGEAIDDDQRPESLHVQRGASDRSETGVETRHENAVTSVRGFSHCSEIAGLDLGREAACRTVGLADAALIREDQPTESTQTG